MIRLVGTAVSGRNIATNHLCPLREAFRDYFGSEAHPGTLNLVLASPIKLRPELAVIRADNRMFWEARLQNLPCLVYRWDGTPLHIVEIVSPFQLRTTLNITAERRLELMLSDRCIDSMQMRELLSWCILWLGRKRMYYSTDKYIRLIKSLRLWRLYRLSLQRGP